MIYKSRKDRCLKVIVLTIFVLELLVSVALPAWSLLSSDVTPGNTITSTSLLSSDVTPGNTITSTWKDEALMLIGTTHVHTDKSDGKANYDTVLKTYESKGFDFIAVTDHEKYSNESYYNGLIILPGSEETASVERGHINNVGVSSTTNATSGNQIISYFSALGGLTVLNHPGDLKWTWSTDELSYIRGYTGVEIYNGNRQEEYSTHYDWILSNVDTSIWCVATDDLHNPATAGRAYIVVNTPAKTTDSIINSIRAGNFYASTGASISSIEVNGSDIRVTCPEASTITWISRGTTIQSKSRVMEDVYTVRGNESYVRILVDTAGGKAWSQPISIRGY